MVQFSDDHEILTCSGFRIAKAMRPDPKVRPLALTVRKRHHYGEAEAAVIKLLTRSSTRRDDSSSPNLKTDAVLPPTPQSSNWRDTQQFQDNRDHAFGLFLSGVLLDQLERSTLASAHGEAEDSINQSMLALEQLRLFTEVFASRLPVGYCEGHIIFTSHSVEEGDDICILFGCNYPMILRPKGNVHRVVGECYIYDLKEGEALSWLDEGKCRREQFTLC